MVGKHSSLHVIGVMFVGLSIISFLLQTSFLNSSCGSQGLHRILLHRDSDTGGSDFVLRRRDENLAAEAEQQYQQADGDSPAATTTDDDDDNIVTGPKSSDVAAIAVATLDDNHSMAAAVSVSEPATGGRPRVLIGIFTKDSPSEQRCRHRQRKLLRSHPHVCSLDHYIHGGQPSDCHLLYTFVVGGNPNVSTELVDDSRPMVLSHTNNPHRYEGKDMLEPDVTLLNIKENMNDGKSQTYFAWAGKLAKKYNIDYVVKQDTDTILYLDKFFAFVDNMLPPAPYNRNILAGSVVDKVWWGHDKVHRRAPLEKWAIRKYGGLLHLYAEGQWYLMSPDLAEVVQQQAILGPTETKKYVAGHEDHDVSAMVFHSERPVNFIIISLQQRHWLHNVKISLGNDRWNRLWERETNRMQRHVRQLKLAKK
ncbi:hypothetical protein MPSEU_000264300 [Mayamaea pseudoterrestris]|nr:hypothetical protein MPSEU_000264300 [Mayamaea pseudoterrestris]